MVLVHLVNAFAKTPHGGNPAGVCLDQGLSDANMQNIAAQVGFSETAFVMDSRKADGRVRFFTPVTEVDLCGHATIALYTVMRNRKVIKPGEYTQETRAGILAVQVACDTVWMDQKPPQYLGMLDKSVVACLGLKSSDLVDLPIEVVDTALPTIIVPVRSLDTLLHAAPDGKKVGELNSAYGNGLLYAFSLETLHPSTAHGRMFAPNLGIPEESATGLANGALACYLRKHVLERQAGFVFEQGYAMNRPSEILARLKVVDGVIKRVSVGGSALIKGQLEVEP